MVLVTRYWIIETVGGIMAKLLLTKEQVFELKDKSLSYHIIGTIMTHHLMDDLLVLHSENERLINLLKGKSLIDFISGANVNKMRWKENFTPPNKPYPTCINCERLHTAIDGAMEEIGLKYTSCEFTASYREALGDALDILNKHLK
jgi:hypothetical protein